MSVVLASHHGNFSFQQRPLKKPTTDQDVELWNPGPIDVSTLEFCTKGSGSIVKEGVDSVEARGSWSLL